MPIPRTWVEFDEKWEHRTRWRVRRALSGQPWGVQMDVVFVGRFRTGGNFGHMDMYPTRLEVYEVESFRPSGNFRPLLEIK